MKRKENSRLYWCKLGLLLLSFFIPSLINAQSPRGVYPVQITAMLYPPHSAYLSDYANPSRERLAVVLLNRDLMTSDIEVRLHLSIRSGNSLRIETRDYNPLPVFRLPAGVPVRLGCNELSEYFQLRNLTVNGAFDGKLPEGMFEISVSAYEVRTGALVSQTTSTRAWITINRPPVLSLPLNKALFPFREPQQFLFQWTPRHQAIGNVEYIFTLKEIFDRNTAVENAFAYSPVIFTKTVSTTSLAYTVFDPPLLENTTYAWNVRAVVREGFEELNIFENNGFSEIRSFTILPGCHAPTGLSAVQEGMYEKISWIPSDPAATQVVAYRGKQNRGEWCLIKGNSDYANIFDLSAGTEYEYKVGTLCADGAITYSEIRNFTLEDKRKDVVANCGVEPKITLDKTNLLADLLPNDVFMAGDFPVTVMKVSGGNGTFSGTGWTDLPTFISASIAVKFDNVQINSERQLINGFVATTYDATEGQIKSLDFIDQGGTKVGETKTGDIWTDLQTNLVVPPDGNIEYNPETGTLVVKDAAGNEVGSIPLTPAQQDMLNNGGSSTLTVQDANGDIYTVTKDENGNISYEKTGSTGNGGANSGQFDPTGINLQDAVVTFSKGNGQYAFDEWIDAYEYVYLIRDKYENINGYPVACKLIPPGKTDKVSFVVTGPAQNQIDASKIIFRSGTGTDYTAKDGEISITGGRENDAQDIYALYPVGDGKFKTLGKLKVLSYKELDLNLVLVKVKNNTIDKNAVENYLNKVYGKYGIRWTVGFDDKFDYPEENMDSESSGLFSRETAEMKAINAAYKATGRVEKNTVYLFILNSGNIKEKNIAGDMPRRKQFGYVFVQGQTENDILWTIAHELGHGRFELRHTFDNDYGKLVTTGNLMDYSGGTHLAKWQWDAMFDPALIVSPFESDEDAMSILSDVFSIVELVRKAALNKTECKIPIYSNTVIDNIYDLSKDKTIREDIAKRYTGIRFQILFDENSIKKKVCTFNFNNVNILTDELYNPVYGFQSSISIVDKTSKIALITFNSYKKDVALVKEFLFGDIEKDCAPVIDEITQKLNNSKDIDLSTISASCAAQMPLETRKKLINYILNKWVVTEKYEHALLVLIEQVPDKDVDIFIRYLRNDKLGDKFVYQKLMSAIDDFNGKDYYAALMQVFTRLLLRKSEYANKKEPEFKEIILVGKKPWFSIAEIPEFEYRYEKGPNYNAKGDIEVTYKIRLLVDARLEEQTGMGGIGQTGALFPPTTSIVLKKDFIWKTEGQSYTYDPLSLVIVAKQSETKNVESILQEEIAEGVLVPAALLMYNSDKVFQQNVEQGVYITLDVASIISSGGTLAYVKAAGKAISNMRKALLWLELANGAINVAVNTTELSVNPKAQEFLFIYNLGTAGFNLACATKNFNWLRRGNQVLSGVENISETLVKRMSKYSEKQRLAFFKDFSKDKSLLERLDKLSDVDFDDLMKYYDTNISKQTDRIDKFVTQISKYSTSGIKTITDVKKLLVNSPDWIKNNDAFLAKLVGKSDDYIKKVDDFYSTTMKNQTPAGFNGGNKMYGGVWYNEFGFPDFEKMGQTLGKKYYFKGAKGNYTTDFSEARDWLKKQPGIEAIDDYNGTGSPLNVKINGKWQKITWHHHENGNTLIPVFTDIHSTSSHSGGIKTIELGINDLFDY